MERHIRRILVIAVLAALTWASTPSRITRAQDRPNAATVTAWVQTFYDQSQSMSADFVQRYRNEIHSNDTTSRGQVRFLKPGRMRFDYAAPNGKVVVSDGDHLVAYEPPGQGEARGQYIEQSMTDAQLPAALGFLTGTGRLDEDFRIRLLNPRALQYGGQILELRGRRPSPHYTRILLFVDSGPREGAATPSRRGMVHRVVIEDASSNVNRFDFTNQHVNRPIATTVFQWRPPRNARLVQPSR